MRDKLIYAAKYVWYEFLRVFVWFSSMFYFRLRVEGEHNVPSAGPVLLIANHQSHLDPPLVGVGARRHLHYVARKSLFKFAPFRWLITSLDAIPLDRDGMGLEGMKQTMKRLKAGGIVIIFPEGTRTPNGEIQEFKAGFLTLARRTNAILLPVGIAGPYQCWPRTQNYPSRGTVNIEFGQPIPLTTMQAMSDDELMIEVEKRVRETFDIANEKRAKRIA